MPDRTKKQQVTDLDLWKAASKSTDQGQRARQASKRLAEISIRGGRYKIWRRGDDFWVEEEVA